MYKIKLKKPNNSEPVSSGQISFECEKIDVNQITDDFELCERSPELYDESTAIYNTYECQNCLRNDLCLIDGNMVCTYCKSDYGSCIDARAEWNNYADSQSPDQNRCGFNSNPLLPVSSYGTTFKCGKSLYLKRLKTLNTWHAMPYHERSLKEVFDKLTYSGVGHGLTFNIIDFSHHLFYEAVKNQSEFGETKISRGDPREGLIAACLYYACKEYDVSRSSQEMAEICEIDPSDVTRGIKLFYRLMKNSELIDINKYVTKYSDFIDRYCNNLGIAEDLVHEIKILANKVDDLNILKRNAPQSMAGSCIYFVVMMYGLQISKKDIKDKCGISMPTITQAYDQLIMYTDKLI